MSNSAPTFRPFHHEGNAILGSVVFGTLPPCVLVWIYNRGDLSGSELFSNLGRLDTDWQFTHLAMLILTAVIGCGALSLFIGAMLFKHLKQKFEAHTPDDFHAMLMGAVKGALAGFLNLSGYGVFAFLPISVFSMVQVALLFIIAGATCGVWIAWQALRVRDPARGPWPRFSLQTLLLIASGWGLLLAVFRPD